MSTPAGGASLKVKSRAWSCSELENGNQRLLRSKNEDTSGGDKASLKESIKMKMKAGSWVIPLHYRNCIFQNVEITYCWLISWQELQGRLAKLGAENEARKRYV